MSSTVDLKGVGASSCDPAPDSSSGPSGDDTNPRAHFKRRISNGIALRIDQMKLTSAAQAPTTETNKDVKPSAVAGRIANLNERNAQIASNGTATTATAAAAAASCSTANKLPPKPGHGKRRKTKKRKSRRKQQSLAAKSQMNYLQLIRYFGLHKDQVAKCHNSAFVNQLEKEMSRWAIVNVNKEKKYMKVQISRRIPLPQRQSHWTSTMEAIQNKMGAASLTDAEMAAAPS